MNRLAGLQHVGLVEGHHPGVLTVVGVLDDIDRAGHRIDLRMGPAVASMQRLLNDGEAGGFDFLFIDADKTGYADYYELGLKLVRPGGVIAFDNVLWGGSVADPSDEDVDTLALRALNHKLHEDIRVDLSMVPIGDGLTLARKRTAS